MSGLLDETLVPLASELIDTFGAPIVWTSVVHGAYDPATSARTTTRTAYDVMATVDRLADRKSKERGWDLKVTVAAQGLLAAPKRGDELTISGATYSVEDVNQLWSGAEVAVYELMANRG